MAFKEEVGGVEAGGPVVERGHSHLDWVISDLVIFLAFGGIGGSDLVFAALAFVSEGPGEDFSFAGFDVASTHGELLCGIGNTFELCTVAGRDGCVKMGDALRLPDEEAR